MDAGAIMHSFELVAERGDPTALVYARLFAQSPEMEPLFVRDVSGSVRCNMLAEVMTALLDFVGPNNYGGNLMRAEIVNHEHLGVPPHLFRAFFTTMRDAFAEFVGNDWTPEIDTAWREVLAQIDDALIRRT